MFSARQNVLAETWAAAAQDIYRVYIDRRLRLSEIMLPVEFSVQDQPFVGGAAHLELAMEDHPVATDINEVVDGEGAESPGGMFPLPKTPPLEQHLETDAFAEAQVTDCQAEFGSGGGVMFGDLLIREFRDPPLANSLRQKR
jgi:hypothetical protein